MRALIVGLGIQGKKRLKFFDKRKDIITTVDNKTKADFTKVEDVPLNIYDTVFLCVPDQVKYKLIIYFLKKKKNIFLEKPNVLDWEKINKIKKIVNESSLTFYTAYNHRFEPIIIEAKKILKKKLIGTIYKVNAFYGNGTARDVRNSLWKDSLFGVFPDLAPHLLDTLFYLINYKNTKYKKVENFNFENKSSDYVSVTSREKNIAVKLETTFLSWKNNFFMDIYGSKGSLHLKGLCKWGPSYIELHKRQLPSGKPIISKKSFTMKDPTWNRELVYFKKKLNHSFNNLENDLIISKVFKNLK